MNTIESVFCHIPTDAIITIAMGSFTIIRSNTELIYISELWVK